MILLWSVPNFGNFRNCFQAVWAVMQPQWSKNTSFSEEGQFQTHILQFLHFKSPIIDKNALLEGVVFLELPRLG